jgi:hypothetical protein
MVLQVTEKMDRIFQRRWLARQREIEGSVSFEENVEEGDHSPSPRPLPSREREPAR